MVGACNWQRLRFLTCDIIAPGQPSSVTLIGKTHNSLYITWAPPWIANGHVRYYQIEYYRLHNSQMLNLTTFIARAYPRAYNITGLRSEATYYVKIAAFTVALGDYSDYLIDFTDLNGKYQ